MRVNWITSENLPKGLYRSFAELFTSSLSQSIISNVDTKLIMMKVGDHLIFPVSINDQEQENSFVCSPYTAYVRYAQSELRSKVPSKVLQVPLSLVIKLFDRLLQWGNIDRIVQANNFLLSTNPYQEWSGEEIAHITAFISKNFPHHAVVFRSLNEYQHQHLIGQFESNQYSKIANRQVYIFDMDHQKWIRHQNNKHDNRIIKKMHLQYVGHEAMKDYLDQALHLYNLLYLVKYSKYNPQFTLKYFENCHQDQLMYFQGYIDGNKKLKAFAGLFIIDNTITSPLVGYDTGAPLQQGLYIHAIRLVMRYKFESGKLLNLSSGAPYFKRLRGGLPSLEYMVVYNKHLPWRRRMPWTILQIISNKIGIPIMKKYEL
ncbi:MAG TPA: hypothetical protein PKD85_01765 [Saprospiraceae bacterium]|nr:hypothetical protein [Saprospiraceae bacterium]